MIEGNRLSSLLFALILLYCISLFSACLVDQMLEDTQLFPASANTSSQYVDSIIMTDNKGLGMSFLCLYVLKSQCFWTFLITGVFCTILFHPGSSTLTTMPKNPVSQDPKQSYVILFSLFAFTARRLLINLLTSELSLVRLSQNRRFELPKMKYEQHKPPPGTKHPTKAIEDNPLESASHWHVKDALRSGLGSKSPFPTLVLNSESATKRY